MFKRFIREQWNGGGWKIWLALLGLAAVVWLAWTH